MRVALVTPWKNAWVPLYRRAFEARGHEFIVAPTSDVRADVVLHGWAVGKTVPGARNIMFLRRFELFAGEIEKVDWKHVEHLICVNEWIANIAREHLNLPVSVIYNAVDTDKWKFKARKAGTRVGMACHVHPKKNLPLALQVLSHLPDDYTLHIAGEVQDPCTAEYLNHLVGAMRRKVYIEGHIDAMDLWWEQMNFCLSTSISEGNPNNVIEAMAKGIKPIVHAWPGAEDQFPGHLFQTAQQAADMVLASKYASEDYRAQVMEKFSLRNIERVVDIALQT